MTTNKRTSGESPTLDLAGIDLMKTPLSVPRSAILRAVRAMPSLIERVALIRAAYGNASVAQAKTIDFMIQNGAF
mgnify:CR=1 FL=1